MLESFLSKRVYVNLFNPRSARPALRAAVEAVEPRRLFADFTVTTVADSGPGSLREAIDLANVDQSLDNIVFNIPGSGVQRIQLLTTLPDIDSPVNLDGYTQPGAKANTLAVGSDAVLLIEINGDLISSDDAAIDLDGNAAGGPSHSANGSTVRGLVINGNFEHYIRIQTTSVGVFDATIAGNYLGTTAAGEDYGDTVRFGACVSLEGRSVRSNTIGGLTPADRNVIGGFGRAGVAVVDEAADNTIIGNYLGLNAAGSDAINTFAGVSFEDVSLNNLGGAAPAARNVIVARHPVFVYTSDQTYIAGNTIGLTATGQVPADEQNSNAGIDIFNSTNTTVGGSPEEANTIAHATYGINVFGDEAQNNSFRFNSIFDTITPIDIAAPVNDLYDSDVGPNGLQNMASVQSATTDASGTHVETYLGSRPSAGYVVDFYANPNDAQPNKPQARTYLGSKTVITDAGGNALFTVDLPAVPAGTYLTTITTALATLPYGNTSQVSRAFAVTNAVPPTPPGLSVANVSTSEGNSGTKVLTFTVKLSAAAAGPVTVNYKTTDGTAKVSDNDYVAKTGTLTFAAGETSKTVSIAVKGDTKVEGNESFNLLLSSAVGATISDGAAVGSISNDDTPPPLPKLSVGGYTAKEGQSGTTAFTFKVTLDKSSTSPITVKYATADDSAKGGTDYTAASGTLTFAAGQTSKTVTIYVKGDKVKEAEEKFFLLLSAPTNATIAVGTGTGRIQNDD